MYRILDCLTTDHDPALIWLAVGVCILAALSTLAISERVSHSEHRRSWLWLLAIGAGSGAWVTHFIAMLGYQVHLPRTYALGMTVLSYVAGVTLVGLGFGAAHHPRAGRFGPAAGGAIVGIGIVTLHYLGIAAARFPGRISVAADVAIGSVVLAIALGTVAVHGMLRWPRALARAGAAMILVLAVLSVHCTAMAGIELALGLEEVATGGLSRTTLSIAITVGALTLLTVTGVCALVDQRVSRRLAGEAKRFRTLADGALEGLVIHCDGIVVDANAAARRMLQLRPEDGRISIRHWFEGGDRLGHARTETAAEDPVEMWLPGAGGDRFPAEVCWRGILLADGRHGELLAIRDISGRKQAEARVAHLALHDPLTDLPNRRLMVDLIDRSAGRAQRRGGRFAVLGLDLDGFKRVNDMEGHAAGDQLLRLVARRLSALLGPNDALARFGGDEFVILTEATTGDEAAALARRMLDAIAQPFPLDSAEAIISVSVGIALFPEHGTETDQLLRSADTALYEAKNDGRGTYRLFEAAMQAAADSRQRLETRLREAIAAGRLDVAFQPMVDSEDQRLVGFEALARWTDGERGAVPPSTFIPVAEETGLIFPISEFVLRRACAEAARWTAPLRVSVNLSTAQFRRRGLVEMVRRALADSGLPGDRLELDITEAILLEHRQDAFSLLTELQGLGVRIAMDDFGTGYSSLGYLQSFPFDRIKIDRPLISGLTDGSPNVDIVRAITVMARALRMQVVAEGVETETQARLLRSAACGELQGYLIAQPMAAEAIAPFLEQRAARAGRRVADPVT